MADFDQLVERVVAAWKPHEKHVTGGTIAIGHHAHRAIRHQLRRVDDPGERRTVRADAVERIVMRLQAAGVRIKAPALCRMIQVGQVAKCFDETQAKALPVDVLRCFCQVIVRNKKNETWSIREKVADQATALWQRVVDGEVSDVAAAVRKVLGKKPPAPRVKKPKLSPAKQLAASISKAGTDNLKAALIQLRETDVAAWRGFLMTVKVLATQSAEPPRADVQVSVPMGDPPGKVTDVQDPSIAGRLLGRRRAG